MRYRLDKERIDGSFCGCLFFDTLAKAERHLSYHNTMIEHENNVVKFGKRYGTIWEV